MGVITPHALVPLDRSSTMVKLACASTYWPRATVRKSAWETSPFPTLLTRRTITYLVLVL